MQPKQKSGFQSSEFYLALINNIVGILVILGYVSPQEADQVGRAVSQVIGGVVVIASTVIYVWGRIKLKQQQSYISTQGAQVTPGTGITGWGDQDASGRTIPY